MKRKTATKHLNTIIDRLERNNGVIFTPDCNWSASVVINAWVFGSYVKGSLAPNDLDILFEFQRSANIATFNESAASQGLYSCRQAIKDVRKGMKMIKIHYASIDGDFGDIAQTKQLIFSRKN
jgi:hypothetical protein